MFFLRPLFAAISALWPSKKITGCKRRPHRALTFFAVGEWTETETSQIVYEYHYGKASLLFRDWVIASIYSHVYVAAQTDIFSVAWPTKVIVWGILSSHVLI